MKKALFIFILLSLIGFATARYSDQFPLGTYSYLSEKPWFMNNLNTLSGAMNQLGYNSTIMETFNHAADLTSIYSRLNADSIDVIISDRSWSNTGGNEKFATTGLTTSSYYMFEAEYEDGSSVTGTDLTDSQYWYGSRDEDLPGTANDVNRVGLPFPANVTPPASNGYVWRCEANPNPNILTPGWAYTDLRWRWPKTDGANIRIGKEFILNKYSSDPAQDSLYIKFHLRFYIPSSDGLPGNTILLAFAPVGFQYTYNADGNVSGHVGIPEPIVHTNGSQTGNVTVLTLDEYYDRFGGRMPSHPFKDIEIRISYQELINKGLLLPDGSSRYKLVNFNPRLRYAGYYTLELDYIEIEDKMHRVLMDNFAYYDSGVGARIADLCPVSYQDMVKGVYTMDEPFQPQFHSYSKLQEILANNNVKPLTATYDYQYNNFRMVQGQDVFYDHLDAFRKIAQPKVIMPDIYPINPETNWNDVSSDNFVQDVLSKKLTGKYRDIKMFYGQNSYLNGVMYPVVQAFGAWVSTPTYTGWSSWVLPPAETQKVLQYLPLCYGSDGIFNYRLFGYVGHPQIAHDEYAALTSVGNGTPTIATYPITFDALHEANEKIKLYGPKIKQLNWKNALTIKETSIEPINTNLSAVLVSSMDDIDTYQTGPYGCHVECGLFMDTDNNPYFMMVNRRANYFIESSAYLDPSLVPVESYETSFPAFDSQRISIQPDSTAFDHYGTYVALFDSYDKTIYQSTNGTNIEIELEPGDGKLLQMCSTLPTLVTNIADVKNIAYLSGSITIDQGAEVTIHPGTTTNIFANSTIRVKGGSTLNVSGNVEIANNVSIIVEDGSDIIFNNATCNWGMNSILQVEDSGITATNTILQNTTSVEKWRGLRITNAGTVSMTSTTLKGAESNEVTDSQVLLTDCRFEIPANGMGLSIANTLSSQNVRITSTTDDKGFYSTGTNSTGLFYQNLNASLFINNVVFEGLFVGFGNGLSSAVGDTIQYCYFYNNATGIHLAGLQYSPLIRNCTFFQNDLGAYFEVTSPKVLDCDFVSCDVGIRTELATATTGGIYNSNFSWGEIGIVSRGSNQRVSDNKFYTNTGILNHAGSILNMGNSAKNLFETEQENLKFQDTATYNARVQLFEGHNDFYHKNPGPLNPSLDFHFDSNWYVSPPPRSNAINAGYNWFEDGIVKVSSPGTPSLYVFCGFYDPSPNVFLENNDRMAQALSAELAGNYQTANDTYKMILNENEISESELLYDALDAYYRTADLAGYTLSGTESYLLSKLSQYETDNPILTKYLQDYLVKNCLQAEAFQAAIDLLELRILNAESPVDSLHAVMNLEIVLQLAAMSESKKPISTKFTQYKYSDRDTFKARHEEHWELLDELQNGIEDGLIPIPDKALISSNYPNPFNPSTTITYSIPKDGLVRIGIYNIKGQKVKDLCKSEMLRGHHKVLWDGKDAKQRSVSSGIYFVKLQASGVSSTRKIMLMK